jgi:hypothetical protein
MYLVDKRFATDPRHYVRAFLLLQQDERWPQAVGQISERFKCEALRFKPLVAAALN